MPRHDRQLRIGQFAIHHMQIGAANTASLDRDEDLAGLDQLRDAGRSVAMRRKILTSLSTALSFARGRGLVAQNVALGVKVRSDDRQKATGPLKAGRDFPTKAELNLLIGRAPESWRPFIVTAIFTGMRASELRGLRWSDVDLENATLHVDAAGGCLGQDGATEVCCRETGHSIDPVSDQRAEAKEVGGKCDELVFTNSIGGVISHNNFHTYVWKPLLTRLRHRL